MDRQPAAHGCVPPLIAAAARHTPKAPAVAGSDACLSYQELLARAGALASEIRRRDIPPETPVAVFLPRSAGYVVAALAILNARLPYLPLDPASPSTQVAFMIEDSGARLVLTNTELRHKLAPGRYEMLCLDEFVSGSAGMAVPPDIEPNDLAYVIYTSGSTGQPKGVAVEHAALANLVSWHRRAFALTPCDRAAFLASPSFDAAVWELWPYLASGASLHVAPEEARVDPAALQAWLLEEQITIAFVATPLAELMIQLDWPASTALRIMLTGADTLHRYPPASLPFQLVNNYGPTEGTVVATSGAVPASVAGRQLPSIGWPIDNVQVYVLNDAGQLAAAGDEGELWIGGRGVARGYINRPDSTCERFVPDPFAAEPGARMYRTGDKARLMPDGSLEFLGRLDSQIKIRGFRVEPDGVAAILNEHPAVQASCVAPWGDAGAVSLVAYLVLKASSGAAPSFPELRQYLLERLPEYSVPNAYVRLAALPLTTSGKVDRQALPAPDESNIARAALPQQPTTPIEQALAEIIGSLLGLEQVSANDNFFLLGGHSLLGTQLLARVRDRFGVDLPLRTIFESPSVAELAQAVDQLLLEALDGMSDEDAARLLVG